VRDAHIKHPPPLNARSRAADSHFSLSLILSEEIVGQVVVFTQQSACHFAGMQPVEARRRAGRITFDPSLKEEKMSSKLALESWRIVLVWLESGNGARKIVR